MTAPIAPSQGDPLLTDRYAVDDPWSRPSIAVDPAELWDRYCAETPAGRRSPQGAMAFAVDAIGVPDSHATLKARIEELETALRFYADARRYRGANQRPIPDDPYARPDASYILDVSRDNGEIACALLASKGGVK